MRYLENLNDMQLKAALKTEGPLLILAGAGSGKTSTMTRRIAHLIIGEGVDPYNILAVTFTNKAAGEMRERVAELLGKDVNMWIMTFHAACLRILRQHCDVLGYTSSFVVYDPVDQKSVVKQIIKELDINDKKFKPQMFLTKISNAKEAELSPKMYEKVAFGNFAEETIAKVYKKYETKLKENNAMDFDDLLVNTVRLFEKDEAVLEKFQNRFKYIMVDEYQDTNKIQYKFIKMLSKGHNNLCVVGDDDQCIYQWRGADISNILNFEKDFPNAEVIKLEQNYRSTSNILNGAHSIISNNSQRTDKKLWTEAEEGDKIIYSRCDDEKMEAYYISQEIDRMKHRDRHYSDFAVLYRTNAQSRTFEDALSRRDIPYRVVGGTRYYDRKEIKDIVSYMRLVSNPKDDLALTRIINVPKRGIGGVTVDKLAALANAKGCSMFEVIQNKDELEGISKKAVLAVNGLVDIIQKYNEELDNMLVSDIYDGLLRDSGYIKALEDAKSIEADSRIENLLEFKSVIFDFEDEQELELVDFLEKIALLSDINNKNAEEDAVALMTMHSAKGLEFPIVFMPGMEDGLFPSWRTLETPSAIEEERRLCYVGMTRAKEKLVLTSAAYRIMYGKGSYTRESQFLRELDEKLMDGDGVLRRRSDAVFGEKKSIDGIGETSNPFTKYKEAKKEVKKPAFSGSYFVGEKVKHKKFGDGLVESFKGDVVVVNFGINGVKKMKASLAKLEKEG